MGKYDDIINLPHHTSKTRPRMSMHDRAAQFSPFAALTGYDGCVTEAARLTDRRRERSEEEEFELNEKINILKENADIQPLITVEYFLSDTKKEGGAYITETGNFRRIDEYANNLIFTSGEIIPMSDIYRIEGDIFTLVVTE